MLYEVITAIEHILWAMLSGKDKVATLLKEFGFSEKYLKQAIEALRGGEKVKDPNAEGKYRSLEIV